MLVKTQVPRLFPLSLHRARGSTSLMFAFYHPPDGPGWVWNLPGPGCSGFVGALVPRTLGHVSLSRGLSGVTAAAGLSKPRWLGVAGPLHPGGGGRVGWGGSYPGATLLFLRPFHRHSQACWLTRGRHPCGWGHLATHPAGDSALAGGVRPRAVRGQSCATATATASHLRAAQLPRPAPPRAALRSAPLARSPAPGGRC